ncbi:MAG: hypothetical protein J6S21_00585, partial [Victivallales bacterium]|nr:hypothetical protein [Victivallales bacterium]
PAELLHRQTEWSAKYFADRFGIKVKTGYNVDSFGHAATLPDIYAAHGMENYVMMRPGVHEMTLPSNLFHWESPSGKQLLTYRISYAYCTEFRGAEQSMTNQIEALMKESDPNVGAAMLFVGVGDHGGGPIRRELALLKKMQEKYPQHEFIFSHPDRFFDEIRAANPQLPTVREELQHHAIGCYSAVSEIKNSLRASVNLLCAAEKAMQRIPNRNPEWAPRMEHAWKDVFFNAFHDVLAGTCIKSACRETVAELNAAATDARHIIEDVVRIPNAELPPAPLQRLIFDNFGPDSDDYIAVETWMGPWIGEELRSGWMALHEGCGLLQDEDGNHVPSTYYPCQAAVDYSPATYFRLKIASGQRRIFTFDPAKPFPAEDSRPDAENKCLPAYDGGKVAFARNGECWTSPLSIDVIRDDSDTWSHNINGYDQTAEYSFQPDPEWLQLENYPLTQRRTTNLRGQDGFARMDVRSFHGIPAAEITLKLHWFGGGKLVKLRLKPEFPVAARKDGILGGAVARKLNGEEYPFRAWTMLTAEDGRTMAVVAKEATSLDVQPDGTLGITLLRSPLYAHHCPTVPPEHHDYPTTEQ